MMTNTQTQTIDAGNRRYEISARIGFDRPLVVVRYRVIRNGKPFGPERGLTNGYSASLDTMTVMGFPTVEAAMAAVREHALKPYRTTGK